MIAQMLTPKQFREAHGDKLKEMDLTGVRMKFTNGRDIEHTIREIVLTFSMPYVPKQQKSKNKTKG